MLPILMANQKEPDMETGYAGVMWGLPVLCRENVL